MTVVPLLYGNQTNLCKQFKVNWQCLSVELFCDVIKMGIVSVLIVKPPLFLEMEAFFSL
jgi:hypothetical protein